MKKVLSLLLSLSLCLTFISCGKGNADKQNVKAKEVLMKVLEKEQTFIAKTSVISDKATEQTLEKYHFQTVSDARYSFIPECYTFADCDSDGINELVILDAKLFCYLILRYDGEKVYGYNYSDIGDIRKFKSDGSFEPRLKDGESKISRVTFKDKDFELIDTAYINRNENKYYLNGKAKDADTVEKYFDEWNSKPKAEWVKIFG